MAESISTPTKISARNPVCRLCGRSYESRYMLRIFSKAGSSKDLCSKVKKTCGIKISEDDTRSAGSTVSCRTCVTFIEKMDQFIQRAQFLDNTPSDTVNAEYSVKRCVQLSLSSHQPSKRLSNDMPPESSNVDQRSKRIASGRSAKQLSFSTPPAITADKSTCTTTSAKHPKRTTSNSAKELSLSTPQDATFLISRLTGELAFTSMSEDQPLAETTSSSAEQPAFPTRPATTAVLMPKSTGFSNCTFEAQPFLDERQQKMIVQAVSHKDATILAAILKDHCPSVLQEYGNDYESIENFDFNKVWVELKTNHPFLIEIMNAVSGKENSFIEKSSSVKSSTII